jgi:predicted Co/Zn/Cd cation transporter (cation efflux family)
VKVALLAVAAERTVGVAVAGRVVGIVGAVDSMLGDGMAVAVDNMLGIEMAVAVDRMAGVGTALPWAFPYEAYISRTPAQE